MKRISTHILDLVEGKPATDVPVRLEAQQGEGDWRWLASARTDEQGRCVQLLTGRPGSLRGNLSSDF